MGDQVRIWWVDNDSLNNQKLTPLLILSLVQQTELWVVPDENIVQRQGLEYRARIWSVLTVLKISN